MKLIASFLLISGTLFARQAGGRGAEAAALPTKNLKLLNANAGLTPGLAGLYQVNFYEPQGVNPGDQVVVTVSVSGRTNAGADISVR